jgi:hypothetical protein
VRLILLSGLIATIFAASFALQSIFNAAGIPIDLMAASGIGQIINYAVVLAGAFLFTVLVWRQSVFDFLYLYLQNWRKTLRGFAACAGLTLAIGLIWYLFVLAAGGARWSLAALAQVDAHALATLLGTALVAIALALTEEILFRALAFKYLLTSPARGDGDPGRDFVGGHFCLGASFRQSAVMA